MAGEFYCLVFFSAVLAGTDVNFLVKDNVNVRASEENQRPTTSTPLLNIQVVFRTSGCDLRFKMMELIVKRY